MLQEDNNRLLARKQVEERYGISRRFLEVAAMRGDGPPIVRVGRLARYRVKDILKWIDAQTEERIP